jgi:hypothetical protein
MVSAAGGFFFYRRRRFSVGLCGLWVPDFSSMDLGPMDVAPPAPTPQCFTPLRDLSGELAAGVLDLGRWVPGLPPILPFVLREIGGVAMVGNFRIRQVLIRPLYSSSALGRQASPPWPNPSYLVLELPQPRRQFSRATSLGRPTAGMGLDVSFDLWTSLCPVLRGRGGRLSIHKVCDIHKAVVCVEKVVLLRQGKLQTGCPDLGIFCCSLTG